MNVKRILSSILYLLSSATLVAAYGTLEHFGVSPSCILMGGQWNVDCWIQDVRTRVFATLGQPNWMAAWLVALMPLAWAYQLIKTNVSESETNKKRFVSIRKIFARNSLIGIALSSLLFLALLYTKSRSGLLGFAVASAVFWGALAWLQRKSFKKILVPFSILYSLFFILVLLVGSPVTPTLSRYLTRASPQPAEEQKPQVGTVLETPGGGTESGVIRRIVWRGALDIWRASPLFGSGVETFAYAYYTYRPIEHNLTSEWEYLYNKAHNEYLNFAATTGTFGLGTYLLLILATLWFFYRKINVTNYTNQSLKTRNSFRENSQKIRDIHDVNRNVPLIVALLAGYISILVTNFFGFSVVPVATLFFLFPAMAAVLGSKEEGLSVKMDAKITTQQKILIPSLLLITFYLLFTLGKFWRADLAFAQADKYVKAGQYSLAIPALQKAISLRPSEPSYYDKLATAYSQIAFSLAAQNEAATASQFAQATQAASDRAASISPRNINILRTRSSAFYRIAAIDPTYLAQAINTLEKGRVFAPTDPKVTYNLALLYYQVGENEKTEELLKKTAEMKPDYGDAHVALFELYKEEERFEEARGVARWYMENIDPENAFFKEELEELEK